MKIRCISLPQPSGVQIEQLDDTEISRSFTYPVKLNSEYRVLGIAVQRSGVVSYLVHSAEDESGEGRYIWVESSHFDEIDSDLSSSFLASTKSHPSLNLLLISKDFGDTVETALAKLNSRG